MDKKEKRAVFKILDFLHIRSSADMVEIHILILDPPDVLIGQVLENNLYIILVFSGGI